MLMDIPKVSEHIYGLNLTRPNILETTKKANVMDKGLSSTLMEIATWGSGEMTRSTVKAL